MSDLCGHVAVVGLNPSRHDCWEDAVVHVAAETSADRASFWFADRAGGTLLFAGHPREAGKPLAWIANPVAYQSALSRGHLEDEAALRRAFSHTSTTQ